MRLDPVMTAAAQNVQVNIPYRMYEAEAELRSLFDRFRLNPELGMDAETLAQFSDAHFEATAKRFRDLGCRLTFHGPFEGVDLGSSNADVTNRSRQLLDRLLLAIAIMAPVAVVCHTGYIPGESDARWIERSRKAWEGYARAFHESGSQLLLENVHEESVAKMAEIAGDIPHAGVCLDTGHLGAYGDGDLAGWVRLLGAETFEIHLHDNHGGEDLHLPPGQGSLDLEPALELARREDVIVTLEPHVPEDLPAGLAFVGSHLI